MNQEKKPESESEVEARKEAGMLTLKELMGILQNRKEEMEKTWTGSRMRKFLKDRFAPYKRFFREMGQEIVREGVLGFIADRIFPLLYFPAWKEMWKMREEQRKREILYASVGKIRNAFEGFISGLTFDIARDATDYQRRTEMAEVKKEEEELASDDAGYLLKELSKALESHKIGRAEACVRALGAGNMNEILRDPKTARTPKGTIYQIWDDEGIYNWLKDTFGERRAHYIIMDHSDLFSKGYCRWKGMIQYDPKEDRFVKMDSKERALHAAIESSKLQVEGEWRNMSHLSVVDEDYSRNPKNAELGYKDKEGNYKPIKPSEFLKARLTLVGYEAIHRGLGRANETVVRRMYLVADELEAYVNSDEFVWYMKRAAELQGLPPPTEKDIRIQRRLALDFINGPEGIKAKRKKITGEEKENILVLEE